MWLLTYHLSRLPRLLTWPGRSSLCSGLQSAHIKAGLLDIPRKNVWIWQPTSNGKTLQNITDQPLVWVVKVLHMLMISCGRAVLTLSASWKRSVNVSTLASWKRTTSDTAAETSAVRRVAFESLATLWLTEFVPFTLTLARRRAPMRMSQKKFEGNFGALWVLLHGLLVFAVPIWVLEFVIRNRVFMMLPMLRSSLPTAWLHLQRGQKGMVCFIPKTCVVLKI